jgi:starch synthase
MTLTKPKKKKILFIASEAVPFCKSGGLADVAGSLPKELRKLGHDVRVVIPRYWNISKEKYKLKPLLSPMGVPMGTATVWCQVLEGEYAGVPVYFVEHDGYFGRAGFYDDGVKEFPDNAERFGFFSKACLQLARDIGFQPDIVHCNDWQTALAAAYLKIWYLGDAFFKKTASVITIHNIGYQGIFHRRFMDFLGLGRYNFTEPKFECWGQINFLKGSLFFADALNAVSVTYREELLTPGGASGLAPYTERRRSDLYGIVNGVDYDHWDPRTDDLLPANYSDKDMSGKAVCKTALQKEFWLKEDPKVPVIGVVARFVEQKGLGLLAPIIRSVARDMLVQFVFLGSGEKQLEDFFGGLPAEFPGTIGAWIGYNNPKAHLIEAGADLFLMPSLYEPCGLNQIYSMKYGTLPIVRDIGGLKDTVQQYSEASGTGTGFKFTAADPAALYYTIGWAVSTYYDRPQHMRSMIRQAMALDFSWVHSAKKYEDLYEKASLRRSTWN